MNKIIDRYPRKGRAELEAVLNIEPFISSIPTGAQFAHYYSMNSVVGMPSTEATVTQTIVGSSPVFST